MSKTIGVVYVKEASGKWNTTVFQDLQTARLGARLTSESAFARGYQVPDESEINDRCPINVAQGGPA